MAAHVLPVVNEALLGNLNSGKVVVSEMGATVPGVNAGNCVQYIYELAVAVTEGTLEQDKFFVGMEAAGIQQDLSTHLAHIFWALSQHYEPKTECKERLADLVKATMVRQKVTRRQLLETQELEMLEAAGVVGNAEMFRKREVRQHTNTTYKQIRFNMLREESEGYAKVITLLNSSPPSTATMPALVAEIKSLIGFFDLDPNRVFDLLLDAAERAPDNRDWLQLVPMFHESAPAEMMGFKFMHHQKESVPPAGIKLYEVAALLVQAGHMRVEEILSYLTPSDEDAQKAQVEALQLVQTKVDAIGRMDLAAAVMERPAGDSRRPGLGGAMLELDAAQYDQQLAMLGGDRRAQKLRLVEGFLKIEDWEHAKLLMHWLQTLNIQPASDRALCATLAGSLATRILATYDAMFPAGPLAGNIVDAMVQRSATQHTSAAGASAAAPVKPGPPLDQHVFEMLGFLRLYLYRDLILFAKVVRVLRHHVAFYGTVPEGATDAQTLHAQDELAKVERAISATVIPSLMMMPANPAMVAEVWSLLSMLPYNKRYELYHEVLVETEKQPLMLAAARMAVVEVKKVFRRIHMPQDRRDRKEALKPYGRVLAKIMHANPLAVSQEVVRQAMSYSSQIEPLVEALKYVAPMAYDALTYVILLQLGVKARRKLKEDGVNVQEWLQALAVFTGMVCKKCPGMEINAICQYVADSVRGGESFDLLVLKELVGQMTGVSLVADVSPDKVNDLCGGELMRQETLSAASGAANKSLQRGGKRLLEALQKGSLRHHLAMPLLILISQQLDQIAINTNSPHLKLIAELYDKCHEACLQYLEFLRSALPLEQYISLLLPLEELMSRYGMRPEIALTLWRPVMCVLEHQAKSMAEEGELSDDDAAAAGLDKMEVDDREDGEAPAVPAPVAVANGGPVLPITWKGMLDSIRQCQPADLWLMISPELYATFWNLSLYDISFPKERYESVMDRLRREMQEQESKARMAEDELRANERQWNLYNGLRPGAMRPPQDAPMDRAAVMEVIDGHKREKQRLQETLERLQAECEAQRKRSAEVQLRLERECTTWLPQRPVNRASVQHSVGVVSDFIQNLVVPRVLLSPADALFCSRFALRVHELCTPYWSGPVYYDRVMRNLVNLLLCTTDREAVCLGIFLGDTLDLVGRWRSDKKVYADEAESKPTFVVSWEPGKENSKTNFDQFQKLTYKWQMKMVKVFAMMLDSGEYVQIRNALLVLAKIVHVFPAMTSGSTALSNKVKAVVAQETREDLKLMAARYQASLARQHDIPGRMHSMDQYGGKPTSLRKPKPAEPVTSPGADKPPAAKPAGSPKPASTKPAAAAGPKPGTKLPGPPGLPKAPVAGKPAPVSLRPDAAPFEPTGPSSSSIAVAASEHRQPPPPPGRPSRGREAAAGASSNGDGPPSKRPRLEREPGEVPASPAARSPLGSSEERTRREPRPAAAGPTREARPAAAPSDASELRRREVADTSAAPARGDNHTAAAGNGMAQAEAAPGNAGRADAAGGEAGGSTAPAGAKRKRDDGQSAAGARAPSPGRDGGRHRSSSTTRERGKDAQRDAAKPGREPSHDREAAAAPMVKEERTAKDAPASASEEHAAPTERGRERAERRGEAPPPVKKEERSPGRADRAAARDDDAAAKEEAEKRRSRAARFQASQAITPNESDKGGGKLERTSSKSAAKEERVKEDKPKEADREERRSEGTPVGGKDKEKEEKEGGSKEKRKRHDKEKRSHKDKDKDRHKDKDKDKEKNRDKDKEDDRGGKSSKDKDKDRGAASDKQDREEPSREESEAKRRRTSDLAAAAAPASSPTKARASSSSQLAFEAQRSEGTAGPARTNSGGASKHAPVPFPPTRMPPPPPPPREDSGRLSSRHGSRRK